MKNKATNRIELGAVSCALPQIHIMIFVFVLQLMIPKALGMDVPQEKMDAALDDLNGSLKLIEEKFIQDKAFIAGDHISLADLVAIVEIMQVSTEVKLYL